MTAEETTHKQRGKPFKPGVSGNPKGRPRGSRSKATVLAQELLDGEAEGLARKVIELALAGDSPGPEALLGAAGAACQGQTGEG